MSQQETSRGPSELQRIVSPCDASTFLKQYFGKELLYVEGSADKFSGLLSWPALNGILRHIQISRSQLRMSKDGKAVPPELYLINKQQVRGVIPVLSAADLVDRLREGATLVIEAIDELHEPILALAQSLERTLQVRIQVNMYASWRASPGFDLHWDDHDVIILQIVGRKRWQIFGPTTKFPLERNPETMKPPDRSAVWDGLMKEGDALYIPRGWWHVVTPLNEPTIHLTVGTTNPTGVKLLQWVADQLRLQEFMRMDIPRFDGENETQYLSSFISKVTDLIEKPDLLSRFLRHLNATAVPRPAFSLPWSIAMDSISDRKDWMISILAPRELEIIPTADTNTLVLAFAGKRLTFSDATMPLFEYLAEKAPITVGEFHRRFEGSFMPEQCAEFLSGLVKHGVISMMPKDSTQKPT